MFRFQYFETELFNIFRPYDNFHMYHTSFRRKSSAASLCKTVKSALQWFQIYHGITFATIHNPAVYLSGARVSIFPTLFSRLMETMNQSLRERLRTHKVFTKDQCFNLNYHKFSKKSYVLD